MDFLRRHSMRRVFALSVAVVLAVVAVSAQQREIEDQLVTRSKPIHERVITLDTHDDISPANFTPEYNYTQLLTTQVNIPKMKEGGLDVAFFVVYVGQNALTPEGYENAYQQAIAKF